MTNELGTGTQDGISSDSAEIILAEARKALFVMAGFIVVIWALQIVNWADHYRLSYSYGILPRDVLRLPDIFVAPFLHFSWSHIEANSGPLFVLGFLAAYRGVVRFAGVTLVVAVTSGLAAWLLQGSNMVGAGASGLVFGYFGYVVARGLIDRHPIDALIGMVMALSYAYMLTVAIPGTPGIGWQDHLGGLIGGVASGWLFRSRRGRTVPGQAPGQKAQAVGGTPDTAKRPAVPDDHPRAALHKELRDLGL